MKKVISLLLALVMCLSLCACGVDEKYTTLLEHLDTDNYEGIKSELSVLSPDFKAEQEQMAAYAEKLAKYESVIAFLEAEDYESALADIQNRIPVPEEPSYSEIDITLDNWEEYFVIEYIEKWHTNSFGEIDDFDFDVVIYIKPEYADRVADKENSKVNYDISYDSILQTIEIDYPSQTYSFTDYFTDQETFQNIGTWNCIWLTSEHSVIGPSFANTAIGDIPCRSYYENVTVNRIQGTLCLYDE